MKRIEYLMLHCSATPEGKDYNTKQILKWFTDRGWKNPGYRQITHLDGRIDVLQPYNSDDYIDPREITNGALGWNTNVVHYSYIGGVDSKGNPKDTRTDYQKDSLRAQVKSFIYRYPHVKVMGHNQVSTKACPSFDVVEWCRYIGIYEKNIYTTPKPSNLVVDVELFDLIHKI